MCFAVAIQPELMFNSTVCMWRNLGGLHSRGVSVSGFGLSYGDELSVIVKHYSLPELLTMTLRF